MDIVGPLPTSPEGYRYCLTIVDRTTGWPEAFVMKDIFAQTVAKILYENWITRFGCPIRITTDQGRQFESSLFTNLMKLLGIHRVRTTPYHPQSNGIVERWHRSLKASLMARAEQGNWVNELPTVLYGLRVTPRSDTGVSAAELAFGKTLRLPSDFYTEHVTSGSDDSELVTNIRRNISNLRPKPISQRSSKQIFVHKDLDSCSHVFIRVDLVKKSLQPPYNGPFRVITRSEKSFLVQMNDREVRVSVDRLKPAFLLNDRPTLQTPPVAPLNNFKTNSKPNENITNDSDKFIPCTTTRSGRRVKMPVRFL